MGMGNYLSWLAECMSAIIYINQSLMFFGMLTMSQPFTMQYLHQKPFIKHDLVRLSIQNFSHSSWPLMLHARRSMSMSFVIILHFHVADILLVFDLKEKIGYFKKHQSADVKVTQKHYLMCGLEVLGSLSGGGIQLYSL